MNGFAVEWDWGTWLFGTMREFEEFGLWVGMIGPVRLIWRWEPVSQRW